MGYWAYKITFQIKKNTFASVTEFEND